MSAYFNGMDTNSLDNKGRVAIPVKMRKKIAPEANGCLVVTRGVDQCIMCYPLDEWEKFSKNFSDLNVFNPKERYVLNIINMWMDEVEMDGQSRIKLPAELLKKAGIEGKVRFVGMGNHMALWNPEVHDADNAEKEKEMPYNKSIEQVMAPVKDE